ncbi:MAG: glycosyltransferase family 2 protein [Actinomycetota bacterium]|nr:glycosyltransferase family 2 protein [Actinomycetota bacterium]
MKERMTQVAEDLDVSIVLPIYNEHGHLREEIERIQIVMDASEFAYEIIVVDDGSTDGSAEELRIIEGIRLVQYAQNRGAGAARKIGTHKAKAPIVVWTDVDMSYPNEQIPALIRELAGYDQVVGARTSEEGTHKAARVPAKWAIRRLAEYLSRTEIPDLNSGFRAFRRDVALQFLNIVPDGFSHVTTLTMAFLSNGYSVKYIDIPYGKRAGKSKFHWWTDTRRYLLQVVRMMLTYDPLRVLMPWAVVILGFATGKLIYDLVTKDLRVSTNTLLAFVAGFMVLLVAVLADLVVQVSKPPYDVDPATVEESG